MLIIMDMISNIWVGCLGLTMHKHVKILNLISALPLNVLGSSKTLSIIAQ